MADIKDLFKLSQNLSLLYIDEDQDLLKNITDALHKVFHKVDDASDATIGLSYARLNRYDVAIIDASSTIMSGVQLIQNLKKTDPFLIIVVTVKNQGEAERLEFYAQGIEAIVAKPLKALTLVDTLHSVLMKVSHQRDYLRPEIEKLNETIQYERKRIGRFMINEKKAAQKIKEYEDNIHVSKNIYELTRLPSKYALQTALSGEKQSLLYLNIDHFDFINSIYGMGKANKLLKECAKRLNMFLPKNGELFHITADEFVILLDDAAQDQELSLAKQIQSMFKEAPVEFDEYTHFVNFSIGIDSGNGKILFVNAKSASKESRYYGGDQITFFHPRSEYMQEQRENLYWIQALKKAFDEDRLLTYYQPIKNCATQEVKHYEVLCRLQDEEGNLISAEKFIYSARLVGLITHITKNVIDKAFKMFTHNDFHFSLNISMYDLHENYLFEFLKYKCEKYAIDPSRVYLEVVKDIVLTKTAIIDEQILALKEFGFHIVIDNFGSDALIYNRILELKAEYLKLDGQLIRELENNSAHTIIIKSLIAFAKEGGVKVIAEHVENEELYEKVKALGIDFMQGYAIAKPSLKLT
ncbi:MAG: EAL domain-containing protein [Helicobacteraceae bacterium]|nr:EAL domain-containing protein [Helicobacteraceae bacterium]